jgi:hypothetical protein
LLPFVLPSYSYFIDRRWEQLKSKTWAEKALPLCVWESAFAAVCFPTFLNLAYRTLKCTLKCLFPATKVHWYFCICLAALLFGYFTLVAFQF